MPIKRRTLRKNSKKNCEKRHSIKRCAERFNIVLTPKELNDITKSIGSKNSKFLERLSLRLSVWETTIKDQKVKLIYDTKRHVIVTFLKPEYNTYKR